MRAITASVLALLAASPAHGAPPWLEHLYDGAGRSCGRGARWGHVDARLVHDYVLGTHWQALIDRDQFGRGAPDRYVDVLPWSVVRSPAASGAVPWASWVGSSVRCLVLSP